MSRSFDACDLLHAASHCRKRDRDVRVTRQDLNKSLNEPLQKELLMLCSFQIDLTRLARSPRRSVLCRSCSPYSIQKKISLRILCSHDEYIRTEQVLFNFLFTRACIWGQKSGVTWKYSQISRLVNAMNPLFRPVVEGPQGYLLFSNHQRTILNDKDLCTRICCVLLLASIRCRVVWQRMFWACSLRPHHSKCYHAADCIPGPSLPSSIPRIHPFSSGCHPSPPPQLV